ncbi:hypothetical protein NL108_014346 [Boleophthalmus pectinirostris]|nr:hypothetical protein NL108_014346 [Boleophthalmus pectinirostris]
MVHYYVLRISGGKKLEIEQTALRVEWVEWSVHGGCCCEGRAGHSQVNTVGDKVFFIRITGAPCTLSEAEQVRGSFVKLYIEAQSIHASRILDFRSLRSAYWEGFPEKVNIKPPCLILPWDAYIDKADLFKSFEPYRFCFWFSYCQSKTPIPHSTLVTNLKSQCQSERHQLFTKKHLPLQRDQDVMWL